jgi:hypothetical protein
MFGPHPPGAEHISAIGFARQQRFFLSGTPAPAKNRDDDAGCTITAFPAKSRPRPLRHGDIAIGLDPADQRRNMGGKQATASRAAPQRRGHRSRLCPGTRQSNRCRRRNPEPTRRRATRPAALHPADNPIPQIR